MKATKPTTETPSFRHLIDSKVLKRADAMKARLSDLHVEPGFNWRDEGEDFEKSIAELAEFMINGGQVPDLEVRPRPEGGVFIVDGHRRRRSILKALELGAELPQFRDKSGEIWVPIKAFEGDNADRYARVATSADGRQLTQLERAIGYHRMQIECGLGPIEIAKKVNKTRQHVDQLLILAQAPEAIKNMVRENRMSATEAMKLVRTHGSEAEEVAAGAVAAAESSGKAKATAKTMKPWAPSPALSKSVIDSLDVVFMKMPPTMQVQLVQLTQPETGLKNKNVTVPAALIDELFKAYAEIMQDRMAYKDKQQKAADAEKQQALTERKAA